MKQIKQLLIIATLILTACNRPENNLTKYVNPLIGTAAHGHTFPGACLPFGMVQLSPDNGTIGWDWCSGYHASDSVIIGFSHTHFSGTGCSDFLDVSLTPTTLTPKDDTTKKGSNFLYQFKSKFKHSNEIAKAGYYSVILDSQNIKVELTATARAGFHKYTFPKNVEPKVVLDLDIKNNRMVNTQLKLVNDSTILGSTLSNGWITNQTVYFALQFSGKLKQFITSKSGELQSNKLGVEGLSAKAVLIFNPTSKNEILVKVGLSSTSAIDAQNNLFAEIPHWDFTRTKNQADSTWNAELNKFNVESNDFDKKTIFYTAVYHSLIAPNLYSNVNGTYFGYNNKINSAKHNSYNTFSLWDTYRALHPLYSITHPKQNNDFIESMLQIYEQSGLLPVWSFWNGETNCMIGYHAIPVITDAYFKGNYTFDPELAFKAMKATANTYRIIPNRPTDLYHQYGYVPSDSMIQRANNKRDWYDMSVSVTLELAFDDWCIAQMAKDLGKSVDYKYFSKLAENYKNIADSTVGFMRRKNANGQWVEPFNPLRLGDGFTEGNSWQYTWYVPQNINYLISLMGGNTMFINKLDSLFYSRGNKKEGEISDVTGFVGLYAQGNEPGHHVPYLYNFAGAAWKTQMIIPIIRDSLYTNSSDGLCGNDDCGQMSAWYIFSALGFYPVNPANGVYAIGSPLFSKVEINVGNGKKFKVIAHKVSKNNCYIQSAMLNNKALTEPFINHSQIINGGTLEFKMGNKPNKILWGAN